MSNHSKNTLHHSVSTPSYLSLQKQKKKRKNYIFQMKWNRNVIVFLSFKWLKS